MSKELKVTEEFLGYLSAQAQDAKESAGWGGRFDDGGSSHVSELLCAYRAGRDGMIPAFWVEQLKKFNQEEDAQYQEYLRLKQVYEPSRWEKKCTSHERTSPVYTESEYCDCGDNPNGPLRLKRDCPRHSGDFT